MNDYSMNACKFHVDEKNRVVVCVIDNTKYMFHHYVDEKLFIDYRSDDDAAWRENHKIHSPLWNKTLMPNRFVGVAHCAPEDTWNPKLGKLIAYQRAHKALYRSFFKRANTYMNILDSYLDRTEEMMNKFGDHITNCDIHLNETIANLLSEGEAENNEDFR